MLRSIFKTQEQKIDAILDSLSGLNLSQYVQQKNKLYEMGRKNPSLKEFIVKQLLKRGWSVDDIKLALVKMAGKEISTCSLEEYVDCFREFKEKGLL